MSPCSSWPDPGSSQELFFVSAESEGVLAAEVLSLPSARLQFSFALGTVIPPLYIRLLLKNTPGQPEFIGKPRREEELAIPGLCRSGSFGERLSRRVTLGLSSSRHGRIPPAAPEAAQRMLHAAERAGIFQGP